MTLRSILIVDDSDEDQFLNSMIIGEYDSDIEIGQAFNGQEALDILDCGMKPDLILLDINMPMMDGFGFLDGFRDKFEQQFDSNVVVLLSSSGQTGDIRKAQSYSCVKEYLVKPLTDEMLQKMNRL